MLLLASAALAATVAVLPLDQGAGGQPYEGLGKALAGMLTTDLSSAPGLTLVERARLDALLSEIQLKDTGFLDEATVQKLGKGLGAEFVVMGSYSVVGEQFLLDARLVGVETAKVVRAADAHGPITTFVDVEKTLVAALLDGLQVTLAEDARQRLLAAAPTRDFEAFAAYGEGLQRRDEGKLAEAQAAFGEALGADPGFREAATALGGLRQDLDRMAADRMRGRMKARAELLDKVIAASPPPKDAKDKKALPGFTLRLLALKEQGRHCQRWEEGRAWLDAGGWAYTQDQKGWERLVADTLKRAEELGYAPAQKVDAHGHRDVEFRIQTDGAMLFGSAATLLYRFPGVLLDVPSSADLLTSMTQCLSVPEQLTTLGELRDAAIAKGQGDLKVPGSDVPLRERLEWSAIGIRARTAGVDEGMRRRIAELIAPYEGDTRFALESAAGQIAQAGELVERAHVRALGFRPGQVTDGLAGLAAKDPTRFAVDAPACAPLVMMRSAQASSLRKADPRMLTDWLAPFRDLGCLVGTPARFATPEDAYTWVATAPSRARPENAAACRDAFEALPDRLQGARDPDGAWTVLNWYYGQLVIPLCVTDPATGG